MGGKDGRPEDVRQQSARVLRKAAQIVGSNAMLAQRLGVEPHSLHEWTRLIGDPPDAVVRGAIDIILSHWEKNGKA